MAFNWKSLFIVDEEAEKAAAATKNNTQSFPTESVAQSPKSSPNFSTDDESLKEVFAVYEKGFDSLNQEGYDFFELYKSVMAVGADSPQSYQMAFAMGKSIKPDLSKNFLLEKAKNYILEIEKVHSKYAEVGTKKRADLANQLNSEKNNLANSVKNMESQIASLQAELAKQKNELSAIDQKYSGQMSEMESKIGANNAAKDTILGSIQKVINGINQNL
jgi:hypothetical protein